MPFQGGVAQDLHHQLVVIRGGVGVGIHAGQLIAGREPPLCAPSWRTPPSQSSLSTSRIKSITRGDGAEVVILQLLALGAGAPSRVREQNRRSGRKSKSALFTRGSIPAPVPRWRSPASRPYGRTGPRSAGPAGRSAAWSAAGGSFYPGRLRCRRRRWWGTHRVSSLIKA